MKSKVTKAGSKFPNTECSDCRLVTKAGRSVVSFCRKHFIAVDNFEDLKVALTQLVAQCREMESDGCDFAEQWASYKDARSLIAHIEAEEFQ